jgi:hypothetical protein
MEEKKRKEKASLHAIMQCSNKSYPLVRGGKDYLILPTLMHIGFKYNYFLLSLPIPLICTKAFNFAQSCFSCGVYWRQGRKKTQYIGKV